MSGKITSDVRLGKLILIDTFCAWRAVVCLGDVFYSKKRKLTFHDDLDCAFIDYKDVG